MANKKDPAHDYYMHGVRDFEDGVEVFLMVCFLGNNAFRAYLEGFASTPEGDLEARRLGYNKEDYIGMTK